MFDVLDTHDSALIPRRIGLQRMGRTLLRLQAVHRHLNSHLDLRWRRPRPGIARPGDTPKLEPAATREDPFLALQRSYWPPRLPPGCRLVRSRVKAGSAAPTALEPERTASDSLGAGRVPGRP